MLKIIYVLLYHQLNIAKRSLRLVLFDLKSTASRSFIGIAWVSLGFAIFVFCKSYLFSNIFKDDLYSYTIYLTSGLMTWYFLSGVTTDGCNLYRNKGVLKQILLPNNFYLYYLFFRRTFDFLLQGIILLVILLYTSQFQISLLIFILNFFFVILSLYYTLYNLAAIGMMSKDFSIMVGYILRIIFFLTPIFWRIDMISGELKLIYLLNPYYHFLELIRNPLIGESSSLSSYLFCIIFIIFNFIIYRVFFKKLNLRHTLYI